MPKIFISYRRAVSSGQAGRLYDRLIEVYGYENVFLDVESIPPGETFESYILARIDAADIFLTLLAEGTLNRIHNEDDWVRREIAYALEKENMRVVPVLVDGFEMPNMDELPDDVKPITARNAAFLYHQLFDESVQRVTESINSEWKILDVPEETTQLTIFSWLESNKWQGISGIVAILALMIVLYTDIFNFQKAFDPISTEQLEVTEVVEATEVAENPVDVVETNPVEAALSRASTFVGKSNEEWVPFSHLFEDDSIGSDMVLVPVGEFMMGSDIHDANEKPAHLQNIRTAFWIDETEITRIQYELCVEAGACNRLNANIYSSTDNQPMNQVTWYEADQFCKWRGEDYRLPSELQWEYAARGVSNWIYPWGNETISDDVVVVYRENSGNRTAEVRSLTTTSWVGAYDMAGNVWEWVSTIYGYDADGDGNLNFSDQGEYINFYPYILTNTRENSSRDDSLIRSLRGGSFDTILDLVRSSERGRNDPGSRYNDVGFRCIRQISN